MCSGDTVFKDSVLLPTPHFHPIPGETRNTWVESKDRPKRLKDKSANKELKNQRALGISSSLSLGQGDLTVYSCKLLEHALCHTNTRTTGPCLLGNASLCAGPWTMWQSFVFLSDLWLNTCHMPCACSSLGASNSSYLRGTLSGGYPPL